MPIASAPAPAAAGPAQTLLDALPLPALLVGRNERIAALNAAARTLLGAASLGQHYVTALRQPDLLDAIERCGTSRETRTARYLARGSAERDDSFTVHCAWLALSGIEGVLVSFEDLSHVEQASQIRRDFVANVSHELRTPLTSLLGFIETLRGAARNDAAARDRFLDTMEAEAMRMERLVADLLSLSRVESQERMRPTDEVDLVVLAGSVLHSLAPLAETAGVELKLDLAALEAAEGVASAHVPGDEDQLRQVLTNLIENAIKYGGAGGEVAVRIETAPHQPALRGPAVVLVVADRGAGIDPLHIPRLTERFYRVDSHRSRQVGGTGLGLAIVKHIVNRHRGRLRIESAPGQGSRFTVILPRG